MSDMSLEGPRVSGRVKNETPIDRELAMFPVEQEAPRKQHELDSPAMVQLFNRLMAFYVNELDRQRPNRHEQAIDEDFYDSIQWTAEDEQVLKERGQAPIVYNVIATSINWLCNTQKRLRTDFKVLPRRKDGGKQAERKTQLLKYLADVNRTEFSTSRAFEDAVKVGIGWLEDGAQGEDDGEAVYSRYESWRNMLWDSASVQRDLSDCRYTIRSKWLDEDVAVAMFPDRKGLITRSADEADQYGQDMQHGDDPMDSIEDELDATGDTSSSLFQYRRQRVRMIEVWFMHPVKVQRLKGGQFSGELYDEGSRGHSEEIEMGKAVVTEKVMMRMHCAIMTTAGLVFFSESPYRHNRYPFTPVWGNKRGRDGMPYGAIRSLRGIQEDINKRASKALAILSSNKVIMESGAVDDISAFKEEVAKPNAVLVVNQNKRLEIAVDRDLAPAHIELMSRSISMIQQVGGITDESMGRTTNATSGKAITARQEQGQLATAHFFDNLRHARQLQGEKQLSLIEQYFSDEKEFRITNMRGTPQYITVNDGLPENDITRTKADFVISESEWNATVRQAQTQELLEVMQQLAPVSPQVVMAMLDLVVEGMDITQREELVKRIRDITGMRDPDAEELTPEEQAKQQAAAQQQALQQRAMVADVASKEAKAQLDQAKTQETMANVKKILADIAAGNVDAQAAAGQAAALIMQMPGTVPVADQILHEAGFRSRTEDEQEQQAAMAQAAAAQQAQAEQQAAAAAEQPPSPEQQPEQGGQQMGMGLPPQQ